MAAVLYLHFEILGGAVLYCVATNTNLKLDVEHK
jgi:hypothetical protein